MKTDLERFAGLGFEDARIEVQLDPKSREFHVEFESAFDAAFRTFADGMFRLAGWEEMTVTDRRGRELDNDSGTDSVLDFIFEYQTVGADISFYGVTGRPRGEVWTFREFSVFELRVDRRHVWQETESGGREVEVPLQDEPSDIGKCRVMVETPTSDQPKLDAAYARMCLADSRKRGEFPFVPRVLEAAVDYEDDQQQVSDQIDASREAWADRADATILYTDLGTTERMHEDRLNAVHGGRQLRYRRLFEPDEAQRFADAFETE